MRRLAKGMLGIGAVFLLTACAPVLAAGTPSVLPPITYIPLTETPTATPATPTPTATALPPSATPSPTPLPPTPTATATPTPVVELMAIGDVMLGGALSQRLAVEGAALPFAGVQPALDSADLLVANLECVISWIGEPQPKAYRFRALPPTAADALELAGVDVVGLANNHSMDFGYAALADMRRYLDERKILSVGAGANAAQAHAPVIVERKGLRVAFLAYVDVYVESRTGFDTRTWIAGPATPGIAWAEPQRIAEDVKAAQAQADVVIVLLHFGLEGRTEVTEAQRAEAQAAIDAGAALVLGSHPHLLQKVERYGDGLIVYSLGNFIFEGFDLPENYSAIFTAALTPAGVEEYSWIPVVIEAGLPRLATDEEAALILAER